MNTLSNNLKLGLAEKSPFSINEEVNQLSSEDLLSKNLGLIKNNLEIDDKFENEVFNFLASKKKIIFELNKHEEIYLLKHKNDPLKAFKYVVFRYKFRKSGIEKINLGYPPYLLIEPVSTCNLRCPFCFQTDRSFTKKPFMGVMDLNLFKKVIDEADHLKIGAVTLASRGEPTLHKQLDEMLDYVGTKKHIFDLKLNTNATFLSEELCHSVLRNNISQIVISADHYIKEDYERLRLNSNFEKILKNVDQLYNIRSKYYKDSITEIRISGVDNDKNLNREKFKEFWIKRSDHVTATLPLERWNTYENEPHPTIKSPCHFWWDRMYIWFDGKVNPCDADYKSNLNYGDINEKSIEQIWNGEKISNYRKLHLDYQRNKINPCDRCGVRFD